MKIFFDVIVIGGGAAGLFCAIEAGRRGRRVLVVERNGRLGRKIAISGGGRCNFTNLYTGPEHFLSGNPDFCRSALARFTPRDFIACVERHGIAAEARAAPCPTAARLGHEPIDRDDVYSKYEAVPPEWMWIEH